VKRWLVVSAFAAMTATRGEAQQVGHSPAGSPFVDLEYRQMVTLLSGPYFAKRDPADVAPQGSPLIGLHYEWRAGGPASLTAEVTRIFTDRFVLDPSKPPATRNLGSQSWPLYTADVGLALNLTGGKSWHQLVPQAHGGLGVVSDLKTKSDTGDFKFGTRFALSFGGGVRWVPSGSRWALRADVTDRLYTLAYPDTYYNPPTPVGGNKPPAILTNDISKSRWTNNAAITLGLTYQYSR